MIVLIDLHHVERNYSMLSSVDSICYIKNSWKWFLVVQLPYKSQNGAQTEDDGGCGFMRFMVCGKITL